MELKRITADSDVGIEYALRTHTPKPLTRGEKIAGVVRGVLFTAGMAIDTGLSVVAPRIAGARMAARLSLRAGYEAGVYSRLTGNRLVSNLDADGELLGKGSRIRSFSREEGRNNPIAAGLRSTITRNVCGDATVGQGITVDPQIIKQDEKGEWVPDDELNTAIKLEWENFCKFFEFTGRWHFADAVQIASNEVLEAGEQLAVIHDKPAPGSPYNLSVEIVEPDRLPTSNDNFFTPMQTEVLVQGGQAVDGASGGASDRTGQIPEKHRVQHGIEYNADNQIVAFHILKDHPGSMSQFPEKFTTKRVLKEKVIHYFLPSRAEQTRGVTPFVSALNTLADAGDTIMWQLIALKGQSAFGLHFDGASIPNVPYPRQGGTTNGNPPTDVYGNVVSQIQPGMITVGPNKATFYTSNAPGNMFLPFFQALQRLCGMSVGVGYSATSRDYSTGSYSALRQEDNEDARTYRMYQGMLARHFVMRVYSEFIRVLAMSGRVKKLTTALWIVDKAKYERCVVNVPGRSHINPLQEITAEVVALKNGIKCLDEVLSVSNMEPADRLKAQARYKDMCEKLNLMLGWIEGEIKPPINDPLTDPNAQDKADKNGE